MEVRRSWGIDGKERGRAKTVDVSLSDCRRGSGASRARTLLAISVRNGERADRLLYAATSSSGS